VTQPLFLLLSALWFATKEKICYNIEEMDEKEFLNLKMKGMMLAAGKGTRLHPLTTIYPKPLMPVANISALEHGLIKLREYDIAETGINVSYRADEIIQSFAGYDDISIFWSKEKEPIGTAGGLKNLENKLKGAPILLISGDAIIDFDLTEFIARHKESNALVTVLATSVTETERFGIIVDKDGIIEQFQEKPTKGTELSNLANTSIYCLDDKVFDLIPQGEFFDFALDLFPYMLNNDIPIHCVEAKGHWTDIGTPEAYLKVNMDFLDGNVKIPSRGHFIGDSLVADSDVSGIALSHSIIGDNCKFEAGSSIENSIVLDNFSLNVPINVKNAVVTPEFILNLDK